MRDPNITLTTLRISEIKLSRISAVIEIIDVVSNT